MKSLKFISLIGSLSLLLSCASHPSVEKGHYLIEAEISGIEDSVAVRFLSSSDIRGRSKVLRQDTIINGKLSFCDTISQGSRLISIAPVTNYAITPLDLYVEPGSYTKISGEGMSPLLWHAEGGSKKQRSVERYNREFAPMLKILEDEMASVYKFYTDNAAILRSKDEADRAKRDEVNREVQKRYEVVDSLSDVSFDAIAKYMLAAEVDDYWVECFTRHYFRRINHPSCEDDQDVIKRLYDRIPQKMLKGAAAHIYAKMNLPEDVKIGDKMVDGELYDLEGKKHLLSDIKSDYILLDFWGVGCGPCMKSIPELEHIKDFYKDKLTVVSICTSGESVLRDYLKSKNTVEEHMLEKGELSMLFEQYGHGAVPQYALISPEREVVDLWSGYADNYLNNRVSKHLGDFDGLMGIPTGGKIIRLNPDFKIDD